jgi:two-component system chemotaxis response regulator CheB
MAIRVLIVDDSATARRAIAACLVQAGDIEVVGAAEDAAAARRMIDEVRPQVMTLDVHMPDLDGLSFLREVMGERPMPVVMVSSATREGSREAMRALELGAAEVVAKPTTADRVGFGDRLATAVRSAAAVRPRRQLQAAGPARSEPWAGGADDCVLAIGASTGGPDAVRYVLERLPAEAPATVIVQHLPFPFTTAFAERLDSCSAMSVGEASVGERLTRGRALVAPAGRHLVVARATGGPVARLDDGDPVHFQRPSVDVTFRSVAEVFGPRAVGVLLTGMGRDGADGLLAMRRAGARTIAQDEPSCVVYGMPRAAAEIGAAEEIAALDDMPRRILAALSGLRSRSQMP